MRTKNYFCSSDVPTPPEEVDVTDIFATSCVVSWKQCKDEGGSPVTKYIIERLDMSLKAQWDSVGEVPPGEKLVFKVEDLVAKKQYKFRIRAVNKIGSSEPALFGKPVLAKDPWGKFHCLQIFNFTSTKICRTIITIFSFHFR